MRAYEPALRAELGQSQTAGAALSAIGERVDSDGVAGREAGYVAPGLHNLAGKLVAHDERRRTQSVVAQVAAQLGAADAGIGDAG